MIPNYIFSTVHNVISNPGSKKNKMANARGSIKKCFKRSSNGMPKSRENGIIKCLIKTRKGRKRKEEIETVSTIKTFTDIGR